MYGILSGKKTGAPVYQADRTRKGLEKLVTKNHPDANTYLIKLESILLVAEAAQSLAVANLSKLGAARRMELLNTIAPECEKYPPSWEVALVRQLARESKVKAGLVGFVEWYALVNPFLAKGLFNITAPCLSDCTLEHDSVPKLLKLVITDDLLFPLLRNVDLNRDLLLGLAKRLAKELGEGLQKTVLPPLLSAAVKEHAT